MNQFTEHLSIKDKSVFMSKTGGGITMTDHYPQMDLICKKNNRNSQKLFQYTKVDRLWCILIYLTIEKSFIYLSK